MKRYRCALALSLALGGLIVACSSEETAVSERVAATGSQSAPGWKIAPPGDLNAFFDCVDNAGAGLISAHRAGPFPGFPENGLETMIATMSAIPAIMEIDVAASADGVLFLMHDDTLDRTTTGRGVATEKNWSQIAALKLRDADGRATAFSPPRLSDILDWADGRTIVQIDFKRSARYEDVIEEVYRQGAEARVILIAYSMASAQKLHRLAPDMMLSLSVENELELNRAIAAGIPATRLMGFTGTQSPRPRLFAALDARDVEGIFGTLGRRDSIDLEIAASGNEARYAEIVSAGADIIATDRPRQAYQALSAAGQSDISQCGVQKVD